MRFVEEHLDAAGKEHRDGHAEALLLRLAVDLDPARPKLGDGRLEVSHMKQISCFVAQSEGWIPSSAGGILKISQPGVSSTYSQPSTSRSTARTASASGV